MRRVLTVCLAGVLFGCGPSPSSREDAAAARSDSADVTQPFEVWSSRNGRLEGRLVAASSPITFDGQTFDSKVYNGRYLPPLLRVQPGDSLKLRVVNRLTEFSNVHYHGTTVSPRVGMDNVLMHIAAADSFDYALYFPPDHERGLFWYHPHAHGFSEGQVLGGMSGLLVVEGLLEKVYPWLAHVPEQILMLKALIPPGSASGAPHVKNINGQARATFSIRPGELQFWRVGNIAADAYFTLRIAGHRFWLLAQDANLLARPMLVDSLYLPPGARAEVLIEGGAAGSYAIQHDSVDTGPQGDPNPTVVLGTLVSSGDPVARSADVQRLQTLAALTAVTAKLDTLRASVTTRRTFDFSETANGDTFFINGRQFDPNRIDTTVELGATEEWTLRNLSGEVHTFHIHQTDFLVTEVNGVAQPAYGLHDTINLPYAAAGRPGVVKIIVPFTNPNMVGSFVYHCHILEHEDGGMMQRIDVVPARTTNGAGYPLSMLARPSTLPRGGSRLDAFLVAARVPGSTTQWLGVLGGGVGVTDQLEMGGQLVPAGLRPGIDYVNPSLYATYGFNIGSVSVAPQVQTVLPLRDDDPFFLDLGANASQPLGSWGQVSLDATFTMNVRPDIVGTALTFAPAIQRQAGERFTWQLTSGLALARVETRHDLSRGTDAFDFDEFTWAPSATVTYTVGRAAPHVLADLIVQWLWPRLYAHGPDDPGWHGNDWALQLQTSIFFVR